VSRSGSRAGSRGGSRGGSGGAGAGGGGGWSSAEDAWSGNDDDDDDLDSYSPTHPVVAPTAASLAAAGGLTEDGSTLEKAAFENIKLWDRSRFVNPGHAVSRLWCLYEVFVATHTYTNVLEDDEEGVKGAGGIGGAVVERWNKGKKGSSSNSKDRCKFEVALHYSVLEDGNGGSSGNIKNKKSPFLIDLHQTCRDLENFTKWIISITEGHSTATDANDVAKILSIMNATVGVEAFLETVRCALHNWITDTLNGMDSAGSNGLAVSSANTVHNTVSSKHKVYIQYCLCKILHLRGETVRAEGAMIEIGAVIVTRLFWRY
jgi:hypothetical protein